MKLERAESQRSKTSGDGAQYRANLATLSVVELEKREEKGDSLQLQLCPSISDKPALMRLASSNTESGSGSGSGSGSATPTLTIKPTPKRFLILLLFALNSANKAYQWLQVPASTTKATVLYDTDNYMINSASIIFMISFILLSWPACFVIEHLGMRRAVVAASLGTATGATIKCFSCHQGGFWLLMIGQLLVSLSEQLIFSLPSRIASVWFPDREVSLSVSLCVVGGELGLALGFLVPQWFLNGRETRDEIATGFYHMYLATAVFSIAIFLVCLLLFDNEPGHVPGAARLRQLELERKLARDNPASNSIQHKFNKLFAQLRELFSNRQLMLLSTSYGIIVGLGYTIQTLLDQMFAPIWPGDDQVVGNTGFVNILAGMIALPLWGRAMDKWHAFKRINLIIATGALLSLTLFAYAMVWWRSICGIYLAFALFGFFHTGFISAGLEFAVELTYPAPELVTSSVMNLMPMIHSILFIFLGSYINDNHGVLAVNLFHVSLLLLGLIFLLATREKLKRQEAIAQMQLQAKPATRPKIAAC